MKVSVKAYPIVNGKLGELCKKFDMTVDSAYQQYAKSEDFLTEIGSAAAYYLDCEGLMPTSAWQGKQDDKCEVLVTYADCGGVSTDVVTMRNGELTSHRERIKQREGTYLLRVSLCQDDGTTDCACN